MVLGGLVDDGVAEWEVLEREAIVFLACCCLVS